MVRADRLCRDGNVGKLEVKSLLLQREPRCLTESQRKLIGNLLGPAKQVLTLIGTRPVTKISGYT